MPFVKGQSGNPAGRASEKLFTDAVRKAALLDDPVRKIRRLDIIAEKLVKKAMEGEDWAIGQVGDRLDGKPKERQEHAGLMDHAIRIIWPGMPPIGNEGSDSRISAEGSVPALPPQAEVDDRSCAQACRDNGSGDQ
jgi:hypothetical protein